MTYLETDSRPSTRSRGPARRAWAVPTPLVLLISSALFVQALFAQPTEDDLSDEERVTAIDLLLSFERRSPGGLDADDFTVRVAGKEQAVVGVEALEDAPSERAAWTHMIYVDCRMASRAYLEWTLVALAVHVESMVQRGPVEVVVADPAPRTLLSTSRDAELLRSVLGQLRRRDGCADLLSLLRDEALLEIEAAEGVARADAARQALAAERNLVRSSRLALATRLTDSLRREGGAQKALFLVHQGFDPAPEDFYGRFDDRQDAAEGDTESDPAVPGDNALARIVASYGWTVVGLETRVETRRAGVFIGDWFFYPDTGADNAKTADFEEHMDQNPASGQPLDDGDPWLSFLGGIRGKLKENKDVGKAESYLELGRVLVAQGRYERAADSFEKALHHFADAPKTRDQQTLAMIQLGNALASAGHHERARRAIEAAIDRNPELAERSGAVSVALRNRGLGELVDATNGVAVRSAEALGRALTDLGSKTRLTFQIVGKPRGELLPLEVDYAGGAAIDHAAWTRSSTPQEVAIARLLRLTDGDLRDAAFDDGDIDLAAARQEDGSVDLAAALKAAGIVEPFLRLTTAPGTALDGLTAPAEHRFLGRADTLRVEVPEGADYFAVLVEDLETGAWGAGLFGD